MIVKIPKPRNTARRLLDYLDGHGSRLSELLMSNLPGRTTKEWADFLELHSNTHRPRLNKYVKHIVLSFAPGEELERGELREIALYFLSRRGYRDAPFVVYYHLDTPHPHLHIVTTPTTWEGKRIKESWEKKKSVPLAREIEKRWGLVSGEKRPRTRRGTRELSEVKQTERSGQLSDRQCFQRDLVAAARNATTLPEFSTHARAMGYDVKTTFDSNGQLRGLSFAKGDVSFKGSQLGEDFKGGKFLRAFDLQLEKGKGFVALAKGGESRPSRLPEGIFYRIDFEPQPGSKQPTYSTSPLNEVQLQRLPRGEAERAIAAIEARFPKAQVLFRPEERSERRIGFRDLTPRQFRELRRMGIEPQWTVQHGNRFDVLVRLPQALPYGLRMLVRRRLADEFKLSPNQLRGSDFLALPDRPGAAPAGKDEARLTYEPNAAPIPQRFVEDAQALDALRDRNLDPRSIDSNLSLTEALAPRHLAEWALHSSHPLGELSRTIEREARNLSGTDPRPFEGESLRDLAENATAVQRLLFDRMRANADTPASQHPEAGALVHLERELALRQGSLAQAVEKAEPQVFRSHLDLERSISNLPSEPSLEDVRGYQRNLESLHARLEALEQSVAELKFTLQLRNSLAAERAAFPQNPPRPDYETVLRGFDNALAPHSLEKALERVRGGDLSSTSLRKLNAAIIAHAGTRRLPLPIYELPESAKQLAERGASAEVALRSTAVRSINEPNRRTPVELAKLFSQSTEVLEIRRRLDEGVRTKLGLGDPRGTLTGDQLVARSLQWIENARARGLSPEQAVSHIANAGRGPLESPLAVSGRTVWLAISLAQHLGRTALRFLHRVLQQ